MGVIGGGGGYATVDKVQNHVGEAMAYVEQNAFKYRDEVNQEKERVRQAEKALQDSRRQQFQDAQEFGKNNPFVRTGTGLDASNMQGYKNAAKSAAQAQREYQKTGNEAHLATYQNAVASANQIAEIPKQYNAIKETITKGLVDGTINPDSAAAKEKLYKMLDNGQIVQTNDANGNGRFTVYDKDETTGEINELKCKEVTAPELMKMLMPVAAFNIDGVSGKNGSSLVKIYNENIGKERKIIIGTGLNAKEKTFNPGSAELAKIMADDAIKDKAKLYELFSRVGIDPEDESNYSKTENVEKAHKFLEDLLIKTAPETLSDKPNTDIVNYNLNVNKEANNQANFNTKRSDDKYEFEATRSDKKEETNKDTKTTKTPVLNAGGLLNRAKWLKENPKKRASDFVGAYTDYSDVSTTTSTTKKGDKPQAQAKSEVKKEIKRSDIASKAKAAGYSVKEYEALLKKNGVSIK